MSDFYDKYYSQLDGATINYYSGMHEDEFGGTFPQFRVTLLDGTSILLEVSRDEEGNGGGFLFGLPRP